MGAVGSVVLIAGSVAIGLVYRLLSGSRGQDAWAVGFTGATFGALAASAVVGSSMNAGPTVGGLYIVPALIGGVVVSGWLVLGSRVFVRHSVLPVADVTGVSTEQRITLTFSPSLLDEPIITQMRRRFGVSTTVGEVEVAHHTGWLEVDVSGAPAAVDAAIAMLGQRGIVILDRREASAGTDRAHQPALQPTAAA